MKTPRLAFRAAPVALSAALLGVIALGGCSMMAPATPMSATPMARTTMMSMSGKLAGANEVPAVMSQGTGVVDASFNPSTLVMTWKVTYSGLTGPVTAAHFHGPAVAGQNAGVAVPVTSGLASPIIGTVTLTPAQAAELGAGKWYFNVHTVAYPGGEIRGQVTVQTAVTPG